MKAGLLVGACASVGLAAAVWTGGAIPAAAQAPAQAPAAGARDAGPVPPGARAAGPGQGGAAGNLSRNLPSFDGPPPGVQPLEHDMFQSKNFYKDQALWMDKRYYRCNAVRQLADIWTSGRIGATPPTSAKWGDCNLDRPRSEIVSPYAYKTAKEHYEALLAQARSHGGPTKYTKATTPDWDGFYQRDPEVTGAQWIWGTVNQAPTILSLLTPEYQRRMMQGLYHEAVDNAPQWNAQFCYPEGFMRFWSQASQGGNFELTVTPAQLTFMSGIADNFIREVLVGRQHVQQVPQWFGETVGFWDGTTLVTWTANVQPWTLSHSMFEFSSKLETVEIWKPGKTADGKFALEHETIFYDPDAFVQPLRATYRYARVAPIDDPQRRRTHIECLSNIRNVNGRATQLTRTDSRFVDYYGRPWAQNWEQWFEKDWEKPEDTGGLPADVLDALK